MRRQTLWTTYAAAVVTAGSVVAPALAQTWRWVPVEGDVYDMLWDPHRSVLYFGRENGSIGVYDPAADQFLPEFPNVGLQLRGMDITPEGHKLFVSDRTYAGLGLTRYLRVVDLETRAVRSIPFTAIINSENPWDVAIGDDGWGFVTTEYRGTGDGAARRVNVEGEYIEFLPDWFPTGGILRIDGDSRVTASPDRSFVTVVTPTTFEYIFTYDVGVPTRLLSRDLATGFPYDPSFNNDGSLVAIQGAVPGTGKVNVLDSVSLEVVFFRSDRLAGFAFDPVRDRLYMGDHTTGGVSVMDTNSWLDVATLPAIEVFGSNYWDNGQYEISADGRFLFVSRRDTFGTNTGFYVFDLNTLDCRPDLTTTAVPGQPGYGTPNGVVNSDDFFYFLTQYAQANLAVCDLTTGAIPAQPGYGVPNGILNSDDFFYFLALFGAGC